MEYRDGEMIFEGFHAYDDAVEGKRPGILVVHQWTGLSEDEKARARQLAKLGYNVFALDIYGKGVRPPAPEASGAMAGKFKGDRGLFRHRLRLGLDVLLADERTEFTKVAAIGYCFGGTGVLEMMRAAMPVKGVVSFHGGLAPAAGMEVSAKDVASKNHAKVLVLHGAADPYSPAEDVAAFRSEMEAAGADYQIVLYGPHVVHSFTHVSAGKDPSKGVAYDERADRRSWTAMKAFFAELFQ